MKAYICLVVLACLGSVLAAKTNKAKEYGVKQLCDPNLPPHIPQCTFGECFPWGECGLLKRSEANQAGEYGVKQPIPCNPAFPPNVVQCPYGSCLPWGACPM